MTAVTQTHSHKSTHTSTHTQTCVRACVRVCVCASCHIYQGLQDPARREETKKELKILWDGVLVWLREVVTSAKQFVERKTAGK